MRTAVLLRLVAGLCLLASPFAPAQRAPEAVTIDARGAARPFPHFWEQMFGSGRAALSLRDSYRKDLKQVKGITDFKYVRFHAIFHDELGVYTEDRQGKPVYNFDYVDQIYDGLLEQGVKPFVELSFMPKLLAARLDYHPFWYKPIVSPPADYAKWNALITAFAEHLIDRYGIDEVASWYFEVWNEPNIDFWTGRPAQQTYFELYDNTARTLKAVNSRIRVGGPATAQAAWVDAIIAHTTADRVPLDFVSTHAYGNDTAMDIVGHAQDVPPHQMLDVAIDKVHTQILNSARPDIPLIWSEFNATYMSERDITDSVYMGPWLAHTISQSDGKVSMMSYWTFSDVFEEQGVIRNPLFGGFGLIAIYNLPKPSFNVFRLLHELGSERLPVSQDDVLVTRKKDGTVVVAAWNLAEPGANAPDKTFKFSLKGVKANAMVRVARVDHDHYDLLAAYDKMGAPLYPSKSQLQQLRDVERPEQPKPEHLHAGVLTLTVPAQGLAVVEIGK